MNIIIKQPISSKLKLKSCWCHLLHANVNKYFVTSKYQKNPKLTKIVKIEGEHLHIFWKSNKKQVFAVSLENSFLEKLKWIKSNCKIDSLSLLHTSVSLFSYILKEFLSTYLDFASANILNVLTQKYKDVSIYSCL